MLPKVVWFLWIDVMRKEISAFDFVGKAIFVKPAGGVGNYDFLKTGISIKPMIAPTQFANRSLMLKTGSGIYTIACRR